MASPEGDNGLVAATPEGCRAPLVTEIGGANGAEGDMAAADGRIDDKVSIHEILEGMTNEFNKGVSPTKNSDNDKMGVEETVTSPLPSKIVDEVSQGERELDEAGEETAENSENVATSQAPEENHKGEEEISAGKQEAVKKDNNIPRIVLTFRTIDENTDHGKKTKISSCSSNLTLVPDELANCDQIGGVSVKIENSDENSDVVEESQAEESQTEESPVEESQSEKSQVEETKKKESAKVTESKARDEDKIETTEEKCDSDTQVPTQKKSETTENNAENSNVKTVFTKDTVEKETTAPVTRKRRIGRPRLRALRFFIFCLLIMFEYLIVIFVNLFPLFSVFQIQFLRKKSLLVLSVRLGDCVKSL